MEPSIDTGMARTLACEVVTLLDKKIECGPSSTLDKLEQCLLDAVGHASAIANVKYAA